MNRKRFSVMALILIMGVAIGWAGAQTKPVVAVRPEIAWFRIDGSRLSQTATKRLTLVGLEYNGVSVPCIVVDTQADPLSRNLAGNAAISCGWTSEAIQEISKK